MLQYFLFITLIAPVVWGSPIPVAAQGDIASHIVIVTPQAQVHLEPAIKYDTATFIHHLSPLARIAAPHEEAIVYVPTSAGGHIIPTESVTLGRANVNEQPQKLETKQWEQVSQQIQQAIQTGSQQLGPQLSEAATAASNAAAAAGQGLFPGLFPSAGPPSSGSTSTSTASKEDKPKITYELPANTEALLPSNARIFALTPAVPHVVDFVQAPVFVGPIPAIRARSIQDIQKQNPLTTLPLLEEKKTDQLPLNGKDKDLKETKQPLENKYEGTEKKPDFGRYLGANALKDDEKKLLNQNDQKLEKLPGDQYTQDNDKLTKPLIGEFAQAQSDKLEKSPTIDSKDEDQKDKYKTVIAEQPTEPKVA